MPIRSRVAIAAFICSVLLTNAATAQVRGAERGPFTFAAIGDMPYELPAEPVKFGRLISVTRKSLGH